MNGKIALKTIRHWGVLLVVASLAIVADQASKAYVVSQLALHESWVPLRVIEPVFRITHVRNTGAAFGMFPGGGSLFLIIAVIVSVVILYYYRQIPQQAWLARVALGLQLGGALGNVIDRVRLGYVVDFLNVEYWPVFNVADSCIVVGVALLTLQLLLDERREHRQHKAQDVDTAGSEEPATYG